jgi:hypothetical protein
LSEQHRAECWQRFRDAAKDGRQGYYAKARALVERIREASGDAVAATARKELNEFIKSDKKL